MKQAEYFRSEQRKIARDVIDELEAAETLSEKTRILEEADYFTIEGIALEVGMTVPQMPDEDGLRERLTAVFVNPESDDARTELTEKELETDETEEARKREEEYMELAASYEELGVYLPESEAYMTEEKMRREYEEYA